MDYFLGFVILLGILVSIHEFGHFIVAKAFGVRVEIFSIGMGKKIFRFRKGETEYALSLIPFGGYVKLTGQDPREELPPELEAVSFQRKPLYQRAAVVLAGPIFNAILAVFLLTVLYGVGISAPAPVLERVLPESPSYLAGFRSGDRVLQVGRADGRITTVRELSDLEEVVGEAAGQNLAFSVERTRRDGQKETLLINYTPHLGKERDSTIGVIKERGILDGVERRAPAPVIVSESGTWAASHKIPSRFYVTELVAFAADKKTEKAYKINSFFDLEKAWTEVVHAATGPEGKLLLKGHEIIIAAGDNATLPANNDLPPEQIVALTWTKNGAPPPRLREAGVHPSELSVIEVKAGSPAEKLGLKVGDLIQAMNGSEVQSFASFKDRLQELASAGAPVEISWIRDGQVMRSQVRPEIVSAADPLTEVKKDQFQIGAAFLALPAPPTMATVKADGPFNAVELGFERTCKLTSSMISSFYHLARGDISPRTLGGPILIGKIAGESFRQGYVAFLRMMAFISLNLFILNLLPVPVLDGGHLILYCIEAIRRRPLSSKVVEVWTTAGFFLLMGLVAVVFFNDLSRLGLFRFWRS